MRAKVGCLGVAFALCLLWAEPSVFGAEKKEQDRIQQELYRLSNAVQQLSESQEGMRSLFDSQANKLQSLYAKNQSSPFVVQSELQAELKELNATLISHFRAYDESLERLKTGLESLGGLIQKTDEGYQQQLKSLDLRLDELQKSFETFQKTQTAARDSKVATDSKILKESNTTQSKDSNTTASDRIKNEKVEKDVWEKK